MADARYVIDLILRAHDQSAEAFASLIGNQKAFEEQTKRTAEQAEKSNKALDDSNRSLSQSYKDLKNSQDAQLLRLKGVADAQVELEKASRNYAKTLQDVNASEAQRQAALQKQTVAYKGLTEVLKDKSDLDQQEIRHHADKVKGINFEISRLEAQRKKLEELSATESRIARERDAIRQRQVDADRKAGLEQQKIAKQRERDQDRLTETLRRQAQQIAREDIGAKKYDELSKSIARTRQELGRLTGDSRLALREQKRALDDAGVSIDKQSRAYVNQRQAIRENTQAIDNYERAVQKAAKSQHDLSRATADQKVRFNFEVDERSKAAVFAAKALAGRDVHVNVEADIGAFLAKMKAADLASNKVKKNINEIGVASVLMSKLSNASFASMEGNVARFDNVMRAAFTLLITFFLPQLITLAGAAGGALLALGSSATFAAGAIGGSLVAGIGQALPVLGVFIAAMTRVKNVFDAVKQANLLQEQQSSRGATQARTSANAENTLTNALESQKQAAESIVEAQERVTESRKEATRQIEDLILAEKRATISVGEAEDALRDAIQQGQAGEIASRRLDLQEAQIRAQRAREDANEGKRTGDPGGRIEDAKKSLGDAEAAAKRAERAVENAKRSSEGAATGVTAAAGKLAFLQAQMSSSERALFNALTTLQNRFRAFAKDISAPLVDSFTFATKRMTALLGDNRIISAAKDLSKAMAREFKSTTDAFSSGEGLDKQVFLAKEATENMRIFGRTIRATGQALLDIAVAASPAFKTIGGLIADAAESLQDFTGSRRGQKEMAEFFAQGVVHLRAWIGLLGSIIRLFAAIAGEGGGAKTGLQLIRGMTDAINEFADSVNKKGSDANKFFRDLFTVTKLVAQALGPVLSALADELSKIFGQEAGSGGAAIKSFAAITTKILIPALGEFLRVLLRVSSAIGDFVDKHPRFAKFAATAVAVSLAFGVLSKGVQLIFGPLAGIVSMIVKLSEAFARFPILRFAAGWLALAAAVAYLLFKYKQLDDVWRGIQRALRSLREPLNDLIEAFEELGEALGLSGKDGDKFLEVLARIIRIGIVTYINIVAKAFEGFIDVLTGVIRTITGVVKVFRGFADLVIGFFTLDPKQMLKGFREVFSGLGDIFSGIGSIFKGVIKTITSAFRSLPGLLKEFGIDAKNAFIDGMKGLPSALFRALAGIASGPLALAGVLARLIDRALPDKISLPGLPDVNLPDNPLKDVGAYAEGGAVSGYGSGDTVAALLEPGEHVWTKAEVASAGGHGIMYALRAMFGGGAQASGRRFAVGGGVGPGDAGKSQQIAAIDLSDLLKIIDAASGRILETWQALWKRVNDLSQAGRQSTNRIFRQIANTVDERMQDASQSAKRRATQLKNNVLNQFEDMNRGVFRGLRYVSRNVNSALDAFGAKPTKISIDTPPGLATGGWIGRPGERGRDMIPTILGRGEAVLNWGHQKIVNSALWNQYGTTLDGMFKSTAGYHAGGPGMGMAEGGFTGPHGSGAGFTPVTNFAFKKFGLQMTAGKDDHNYYTTSGNVSDHALGMAGDYSNGVLTPQEDAFSNFWLRKAPAVVKQLIWRNKDQQEGFYVGGHEDHVHLALLKQYAFDAARMARIISRASRGLSIASLLSGGSFDVEHLDKIKVKGQGPLANLTKGALDKLVKFANKYIDKIASKLAPGAVGFGATDPRPGSGAATRPQMEAWATEALHRTGHGASPEAINKILALAMKESSWIVDSINLWDSNAAAGNPSGGLMHVTIDKVGGSKAALFDPILNMMASIKYQFDRYGGLVTFSPYAQGGVVMPQFAEGGVIGGGQDGQPTPILAHAGEWVLNRTQQSKLLTLLGVTSGRLQQFLGFAGGPTSFQGGGEVGAGTAFTTEAERQAAIKQGKFIFPSFPIETFNQIKRAFEDATRALRNAAVHIKENLHIRTERYLKTLQQITGEGGLLDILSERIERHTEQMATKLLRDQFVVGRRRGRRTVFRRLRPDEEGFRTDDELAEQAIANQIRTFNELTTNQKRIRKLLGSIKKQDERLRKRIAELRKGGVTDREVEIIDELQGQRVVLRGERKSLRTRLEDIQRRIAEQIEAIYEARTEQIRKLSEQAGRPVEIASLWERVHQAIGNSMVLAGEQKIGAMQQQLQGLNQALAQARKLGNQELVQDLQSQIAEVQVSIFEAQMELLRTRAQEAIQAAEKITGRAQISLRIAQALGQSTVAAQGAIVNGLQNQLVVIQEQINAAQNTQNIGLTNELRDTFAETQATLIEAQQELMRTIAQNILDQASRQTGIAQIQQRVAQALGLSTVATQQAIITGIQGQIQAVQQAIQLSNNAGNTAFSEELQEQLRELQTSLIEAQQELLRSQITEIRRTSAQQLAAAQLDQRIRNALGESVTASQNAIIQAIQAQVVALNQAIQLATSAGNVGLVTELQTELGDLQATLIEAQQELVRQQIAEIQAPAALANVAAQMQQRLATALGQSTTASQEAIINSIELQLDAAITALALATGAGNQTLVSEIQEQVNDLQAAIIEAQQTLFQSAIDGVNEISRQAQFQLDLRNRLADLMERGGDAIGASQIREQILAAQRVNISALMENLQALLDQQLALPVNEQNQTFIRQLTEQVQDLEVALDENTLALVDSANATRDAMITAINQPAQFQTGVLGNLNNILTSLTNILNTDTSGQQRINLEAISEVLSSQGGALRNQLLNWLGVNLLGLSGTEFVTAIAGLDWQTLTLGMSAAEKQTFEALINAIIENQLNLQQNTEALNELGGVFNPQDFTSIAWQWFRTAIFTGSGGLLPQFQPPGLQEGGTVLRTGMALVHEGEWFVNPTAGTVPSGAGSDIHVTVNEAGGPLDVEHLVNRLTWEQQGRRR